MMTLLEPCNNRAMRIVPLLLLLCTLIATPSALHAQEANEQAAAQALFDEGMRLFSEEKYADSCAKFEASLALVDGMGTRGKLAECYEKVGRTASAWAAYREVAVLAKRAGQTEREQVAAARAARLQATLSYLTIVVAADAQLPGLEIRQNGVALNPGAFGSAIATDPGPHSIEIRAEGYHSQTLTVEVGTSEKKSVEIPTLEAKAPVAEAPPAQLPQAPQPAATSESSDTWRTVGMTSVAVGGGSLFLATILSIVAKGDYDAAFTDGLCSEDNVCTPEGATQVNNARSLANTGTVFAIAAPVFIGVGAYLWLSSPAESKTPVKVQPTAGNDNLGLSLSGRF